jgi:hypothetical protein
MRKQVVLALLLAAAAAGPAVAQDQRGGVPTETEERSTNQGSGNDLIWNLVGCLGLLGVFGLWRNSDNDGYTDDPI